MDYPYARVRVSVCPTFDVKSVTLFDTARTDTHTPTAH